MKPVVFIAEDEPYIVESLTFLMEQAGFAVTVATDGGLALEGIRQAQPRVVILDIMMKNRNGLEILKAIRADPALHHLPVLVLTAKGQDYDRRTALDLGADAFITKPYSNGDVVSRALELAASGGHA